MKRLELMIANGELIGKRFSVSESGLRLGRSSSNDIHIPDAELSRNHCLFEPVGETGLRITDLASANGTLVNGRMLGGESVNLHAGDLIEVGATILRVVDEGAALGGVDLGLESSSPLQTSGASQNAQPRAPLIKILWGVVVLVSLVAIGLLLVMPPVEEPISTLAQEEKPEFREMFYEKVEADLEGIFRYEMSVSLDGIIRVTIDDTKENRHPQILPQKLNERACAELADILSLKALREIDDESIGAEPDPPALTSWRLRVVYSTAAKDIRIVNTAEPPAFKVIREKLEAFSKNELGIHAIQYPRAKLIELAEASLALGKTKWEDRDVQHGNIFAALSAFRETLFYLDTIDPKPNCAREARQYLDQAQKELTTRYENQRFQADRAINLSQWEDAQRELSVLLEMIPDRNDDRYREAAAKLVDVEKRVREAK